MATLASLRHFRKGKLGRLQRGPSSAASRGRTGGTEGVQILRLLLFRHSITLQLSRPLHARPVFANSLRTACRARARCASVLPAPERLLALSRDTSADPSPAAPKFISPAQTARACSGFTGAPRIQAPDTAPPVGWHSCELTVLSHSIRSTSSTTHGRAHFGTASGLRTPNSELDKLPH